MKVLLSTNEFIDGLLNTVKREFTTGWGIFNLTMVCIGVIILMDIRNYGFERAIAILVIGLLPCMAIVNRLEKKKMRQ